MTSKSLSLTVSALVGLVGFFGSKVTARGDYESAEYTVLETAGDFEIREYPELTLVTTSMQFERQGADGSFMRLFRYISGANEAEQQVAMTTPVFMQPQTEQKKGLMAFVLPKKVAAEGAPKPSGAEVALGTRAGGRFAVLRFSGRLNPQSFADAERRLRAWMSERGIPSDGEAESAGYDPPWTPGPLRRNEVLIRVP